MLIPLSERALIDPTRVVGIIQKEGQTIVWVEGGFTLSFAKDTPTDVAAALGLEV